MEKNKNQKKKKKRRIVKGIIFIIVFVILILVFYQIKNWQTQYQTKEIVLAPYHIIFAVPKYLKVDPMGDTQSFITLAEIKAHVLNFKEKGIRVTYFIQRPWTPNIYNIPFGNVFNNTGQTTQLDSTLLLDKRSILSPNQVTMYTYLSGDASGHKRGTLGSAHQGDVRLDFETPDHVVTSEAVFFQCLDDTTGVAISKRCEEILKTFLSSLKVVGATTLASPPSFDNKNYFGALESKRRFFDPNEKILPNYFLNKPDMAFPYFSAKLDSELTNLTDDNLQPMRCMPEQLYLGQSGYPHYEKINGDNNYFTIRTTDGNNLFYEVKVSDLNLLSIIKSLNKNNAELTQFFACQTDDGRFVVKYNRKKFAPNQPGAQSVSYLNEKSIIAEIAIIDSHTNVQKVVSIPLQKNTMYCEDPLALTNKDIFYMACNVIDTIDWGTPNARYIYKIDLNTKTYTLLSQCNYDYNGKDISKSVNPIATCK